MCKNKNKIGLVYGYSRHQQTLSFIHSPLLGAVRCIISVCIQPWMIVII